MKRKIVVLAMAASIFGACGCSAQNANTEKAVVEPGKILVAYYSYSGNTRFAAEQIRNVTGGDLFEIRPVKAYPAHFAFFVHERPDNFPPAPAHQCLSVNVGVTVHSRRFYLHTA